MAPTANSSLEIATMRHARSRSLHPPFVSADTAPRPSRQPRPGATVEDCSPGWSPRARPRAPLWLHLHFPELALEVLTRGSARQEAWVLGVGEGSRAQAWKVGTRAATLGIRAGMPLSAAHALGHITVLERDPRAEQQALLRLAHWALQFSPQVSVVADSGLDIEIGGSLRLFGGTDGLLRGLRRGLRELGYRVRHAIAPTPLAATALARVGSRARILDGHELARHLAPLPLEVLEIGTGEREALASAGVRTIGECRRLPRGGLARRCSPALLEQLDRLHGLRPDPRTPIALPRLFEALLDLPWEVHAAPALVTAAERLLHELEGHLRAGAAHTRCLHWRLVERNGRSQRFDLRLTEPTRDARALLVLMRERLARQRLTAPVRALELKVDDIVSVPQPPVLRDLFAAGWAESGESCAAFFDRLRARCGEGALQGVDERLDHRPEHAWAWRTPQPGANGHRSLALHVRERAAARPLWLARQPVPLATRDGRPQFDGPLTLHEERERIEGGWWEERAVARDYFVATTRRGSRLWIYRELDGERRWLLHGVFD